jgi:phosphoglucomutase
MTINPAAGKPADPSILVNVPKLVTAYYELRPDPSDPRQRVVFGTSESLSFSVRQLFVCEPAQLE